MHNAHIISKSVLLYTALLSCLLVTSNANAFVWSSGQITLPNGKIAKKGQVRGYAFEAGNNSLIYSVSFYSKIVNGNLPTVNHGEVMVYDSSLRRYTDVSYWYYHGESDDDGRIILGKQEDHYSYPHYAQVYYFCDYKGYEYFIAVKDAYYYQSEYYDPYAKPNVYNNLAVGKTWQRGRQLPKKGFVLFIR